MNLSRLTTSVLCLLLSGFAARAEVIFKHKGEELVFLRGNVDFTLVHPLKILHGHIGDMSGVSKLEPGELLSGVFVSMTGDTGRISFDEPQGAKIQSWMGAPTPWKVESYTLVPKRREGDTDFVELVANWTIGPKKFVHNVPVSCQADEQTLRCRLSTVATFSGLGWDRPIMLFFPVADKFEVTGEFVFGEKGGAE